MRDLKEDFENNARLSSRDIYGKRVGRPLKPRQVERVEKLLPRLALPLDLAKPTDPREWFDNAAPTSEVWVEIGFGAGEHLAALAEQHPDVLFIGVEYYLNGVSKLFEHIEKKRLNNIRVHHGDGRDLTDALSDQSIDRLFVLQPDPWPKRRHHDRRIIRRDNLEMFARVLKPGKHLRLSTDHQGYLPWMIREMLAARDLFHWTAKRADDWRCRPDDWPDSRYAAKGRAEGRPVTYLEYLRA